MKKIFEYILSIFIAIILLVFFFINLFSSTVLKQEYILSNLESNGYYSKIKEQVDSNFKKYIYQSGLDEEVLDNTVTAEDIENDTKIIIENVYNGLNREIDTSKIEDKLNKNIEESLKDRYLSKSEKESIDTFVKYICDEYKSTILYRNYGTEISQKIFRIEDTLNRLKNLLLIVIIVDFLLLFVLNLKRMYEFITLSGVSFIIYGLTLVAVDLFIKVRMKLHAITILNETISEVLRNTIKQNLSIILKHGILFIIVGVFLIFISNLIHNKKQSNKKTKENTKNKGEKK